MTLFLDLSALGMGSDPLPLVVAENDPQGALQRYLKELPTRVPVMLYSGGRFLSVDVGKQLKEGDVVKVLPVVAGG